MQRRAAVAAAVAAIVPATASAQDGIDVSPVVVTATRTAETADESLSSVSVITRQDIERSQATSLPELLGRVQGVELTRNGGRGKASSLFIRGTNSDHVAVLVDGVRVGSATLGTTSFESLPLANVERIEVVRGPRSSLYGSDAIGGVIQIFTRESSGAHAGVAGGSNDYRRLTAGYGAQGERGGFSIDLSAEDTEGFDARENTCALCADEPDDDGFESTSASLSAHRQLGDDVTVSGSLLFADSENEFDGSFQNSSEQEQTAGSGEVEWSVTSAWQTRLRAGRSSDESVNFLDGNEVSDFETVRTDAAWQNDVTIGASQVITLGVDVLRDEIDSDSTSYDVTERETVGAFLQHQWTGGAWDTQVSLRRESFDEGFDDPAGGDELEDQTTGSIAAGYRFANGVRLFGSYGTAFRAPSFNQLFFPGFGNPALDPEESRTLEVGLRGRNGPVGWEVTAYRTEIDELIVTEQQPGGTFQPVNTDEARIQGVEAGVDASGEAWSASLAAGLKDPEDTETGNQLARRAEQTLRASLTRSAGAWSAGVDLDYRGQRFDTNANTTALGSYALVDLRAGWRPAPDWKLSVKVGNVGDVDYQLVDTYRTDGRNYLVQVDWRPGAGR